MGLFDGGGGSLGGLLNSKIGKVIGGISSALSGLLGSLLNGGKNNKEIMNYTYKYKVSSFRVCLPGQEPISVIPQAINKIVISRMYDKNIHPICEMLVQLPPRLYQEIIRNKNEVTFILRVQATAYNARNKPVFTHDYINGIFCIITDDEFEYKEEPLKEKADAASGKSNYNVSDYNMEFFLTLWKERDIKAIRTVVNKVYENTTLSTVLGKVYSEVGIDKVLISPIDNNKSYPEVIIPPMNLYDLPKYLETVYGTYYTGTVQFLDYRCMYILSRSGVCDAYEDGEYKRTIFIVKKPTSTLSARVGTSEDSEAKIYYIFTENDNVGIESPSASNDAISGNNVSILDPNTNQTTTVEGVGVQRGSGNERVHQDNYGNDFNKTTILADINESNKHVTIILMDYNEESITPNKEFLLVFEDTDKATHNGFYRIIASEVALVKTGDQLDITGRLTLVFKAPLSGEIAESIIASTKLGIEPLVISASPVKPTGLDMSGCYSAVPSNTIIEGPKPKILDSISTSLTQNINDIQDIKKNLNFSYDNLGNVQGVDMPEHYSILDTDDAFLIAYKQSKQADLLPCDGPQPKVLNF